MPRPAYDRSGQHRQQAAVRDDDDSGIGPLCDAFGWGLSKLEWVTVNALKGAFIPFDERLRLIDEVVKPGDLRLRSV